MLLTRGMELCSLLILLLSTAKGFVPQPAVTSRPVVLHSLRWNERVDAQVDAETELPPFPDFATWKFYEGIEEDSSILEPKSLFVTTAMVLFALHEAIESADQFPVTSIEILDIVFLFSAAVTVIGVGLLVDMIIVPNLRVIPNGLKVIFDSIFYFPLCAFLLFRRIGQRGRVVQKMGLSANLLREEWECHEALEANREAMEVLEAIQPKDKDMKDRVKIIVDIQRTLEDRETTIDKELALEAAIMCQDNKVVKKLFRELEEGKTDLPEKKQSKNPKSWW